MKLVRSRLAGGTLAGILAGGLSGAVPPAQASQDNPPAQSAPDLSGLHDFDLRAGEWHAHHRRLKERLAGSHEWVEFDGTCWSHVTATAAHWEQAFSADAGKTWEVNWTTDFQRAP